MQVCITSKEGAKGRTFSASALAYLTREDMVPSRGSVLRPLVFIYACSLRESKAFTANARLGREIQITKKRSLELLRAFDYTFKHQTLANAIVTTAYLKEYLEIDPGMVDPRGIQFCLCPTSIDLDIPGEGDIQQLTNHLGLASAYLREEEEWGTEALYFNQMKLDEALRLSPLVAAFLDRRSHSPILQDKYFKVQLTIALSRRHLLRERITYEEGLDFPLQGWVCSIGHKEFDELLVKETRIFLKAKKGQR